MRRPILFLLLAMFGLRVFGADTVTSGTMSRESVTSFPGALIVTVDCVSDASGYVTVALKGIFGTVMRVTVKPDGGGTQPSDNFDVAILDDLDVPVLGGAGANLSNASQTTFLPCVATDDGGTSIPMPVYGDLALAGTNVGEAKGFTLRLYIRPGF